MTIIKVPTQICVSPQDGSKTRLDTDTDEFYDTHDNRVKAGDLAGGTLVQEILKWLRINFHGAKVPHTDRRRRKVRRTQKALQKWKRAPE